MGEGGIGVLEGDVAGADNMATRVYRRQRLVGHRREHATVALLGVPASARRCGAESGRGQRASGPVTGTASHRRLQPSTEVLDLTDASFRRHIRQGWRWQWGNGCSASTAGWRQLSGRDEVRDLLIEARLHAATADNHLELLQIQLERVARGWERDELSREGGRGRE